MNIHFDETALRDTQVVIDTEAIRFNFRNIKEMCGDNTAVMPVIKANAYGHGAGEIARVLHEEGAVYLAVATLTEALELRALSDDYEIFILGHTPDRLLEKVVDNRITQTVFSYKQAELLSALACGKGVKARVHLKVDTGFHRLGTDDAEELKKILQLPGIEAEGIFSHLALASYEDDMEQFRRFMNMVDELERDGFRFKYKHIADSIACVDYPEFRLDMVRPGALIFGLKSFHKGHIEIKQAISMITKISQLHRIPEGEGVSYDYCWKAPRDSVIATLPFGYADGYPRNMRDKGYVTIRGIKCPLVGVLCMDQCMADVTHVPGVSEDDIAVIYGDGTDNTMNIQEASELAGTNKNEIIARIMARPVRVYY